MTSTLRKLSLWTIVAAFAVTPVGAHDGPARPSSSAFVYAGHFGPEDNAPGVLRSPTFLAVDPFTHDIYVSEYGNHRVQRFSQDGLPLGQIGSLGQDPGFLDGVRGVAVDAERQALFVADHGSRVQLFGLDGDYLGEFGNVESSSTAIAIDPRNRNVIITSVSKVTIYDQDGTEIRQFGSHGSGPGQFSTATGVAVHAISGNILVGDDGGRRIQIFNEDGQLIDQIQNLNDPMSVAVDPVTGRIFVSERSLGRFSIFDAAGELIRRVGIPGVRDGEFVDAYGIAVDTTLRRVLVSDYENNRVQAFDVEGNYLWQFGLQGYFDVPTAVAFDAATGVVAVADSFLNRVQVFDRRGNFLHQFGSAGNQPGHFFDPSGIAFRHPESEIFVSDRLNCRVQVFSMSGVYRRFLGGCGTAPGRFEGVSSIALTPDSSKLLVTDHPFTPGLEHLAKIQVLDMEGNYLTQFGQGRFLGLHDVAIQQHTGEVFVADGNSEIQIFDQFYDFSRELTIATSGEGQYASPRGLAHVPKSGALLVADIGNSVVKMFDSAGTLIDTVGSQGSEPDQLAWPDGVAVDPVGQTIYVADNISSRVQMFVRDLIYGDDFEVTNSE